MSDEEIPPNATVYVRNLDESVKIPELVALLRTTFSTFGNVVDVIAKKSLKRKGQAFVIFDSVDSAQDAIDELQGFELFDQQMHLAFAKSRSDATVQREEGEAGLAKHKETRLAAKERKQAAEAAEKKQQAKRSAADALVDRPAKAAKPGQLPPGAVPDEYLSPNKTLLLRDLPDDYSAESLSVVFGRFAGFKEVRLVPGRSGIGFAEYEDEANATAARDATNGMTLSGQAIKVTYQRQ